MKYIVFDTETVGLPGAMGTVNGRRVMSNGEIIQFSAIVCNSSKEIEDFISFYCMPSTQITDEAYNVHHISNKDIPILSKGLPLEYYLCDKYKDVFYSKGNIFVGHNVSFDMRAVNRGLEDYGNPRIDFGNEVSSSIGLNPNRNYHMDTMDLTKSVYGYYKKPKLIEAVDLCKVGPIIDELYPSFLDRFHKRSSRDYHNADYDTYSTWAVFTSLDR